MNIKVVGVAIGSKNIEVWHFERHDDHCKRFCELLVRETGFNVTVIEGEVIGTYKTQDRPVDYIPFENRFKEMAKTTGLPSTYSGEFVPKKE